MSKRIWNATDKYSILNFEEVGATLTKQGKGRREGGRAEGREGSREGGREGGYPGGELRVLERHGQVLDP